MEGYEVAQEQECCEVEDHGDDDRDLELHDEYSLVEEVVAVDERLVLSEQMDEDEEVRHVVEQTHDEDDDNQPEEQLVVGCPDAVVQPSAVVVESAHASVA